MNTIAKLIAVQTAYSVLQMNAAEIARVFVEKFPEANKDIIRGRQTRAGALAEFVPFGRFLRDYHFREISELEDRPDATITVTFEKYTCGDMDVETVTYPLSWLQEGISPATLNNLMQARANWLIAQAAHAETKAQEKRAEELRNKDLETLRELQAKYPDAK